MKAILVVDVPDDINLDFCRTRVRVEQFVFPVKEVVKAKYSSPILIDWCPLKPMPEKKVSFYDIDIHEYDKSVDGWNACIDAILEPNSANGEAE